MPYTFNQKYGVSNIQADFDQALLWVKSYGINTDSSRLAIYKKEISKLQTRLDAGPIKSTDIEIAAENLLEALEVIDIWSALKNYTGKGLDERLKRAFYGTTYRKNEASEGSNPRDFSYELWVNARIIKAGFEVDLSCDTDAKTKVGNNEIYIECKRPAGDNIGMSIAKAFKQLNKAYLSNPKNFRGYIAITVERFFNKNNKLVFIKDIEEVRGLLEKTVQEFNNFYKSEWRKEDRSVDGVFIIMRSPFYVQEDNSIIFGTWLLITNSRPLNKKEKGDLVSLGNLMNNATNL